MCPAKGCIPGIIIAYGSYTWDEGNFDSVSYSRGVERGVSCKRHCVLQKAASQECVCKRLHPRNVSAKSYDVS
jgi:hypothetical protein